jgi:predicted nucleotidyltransferase
MPIKGITIPNVGNKEQPTKHKSPQRVGEAPAHYAVSGGQSIGLADALFTTGQQRVLGLLFGQPQHSFTVSDIIVATGAGSGAAQREVAKLLAGGLVTVRPVGNQKRYQANAEAPIHAELVGIIRKTIGLAEPLREALAPLADKITAAFVYGSVAKRSDTADSDIDLMVLTDSLTYADVVGALHPVIEQLGREVNPTLYSRAELAKRIKQGNAFVARVLEQPKLWVLGSESDLRTG